MDPPTPENTESEPADCFKPCMSTADFRESGMEMIDYICKYLDTIESRNVIPDVEPGYLRPMMPEKAPEDPESWPDILNDVDKLIMPGITHWQHPRFHAYFPAGNSFPSIMGDMLSNALGTIGFSWAASPAMAELEIVVLDWLAGLMGLPEKFTHEGTGGGVLQGSASDCILLSMLAARYQAIEKNSNYFSQAGNANPETAILSRLVAYCSNIAHSSVEKAGMISFVQVRQLEIDEDFAMNTEALEAAIIEDIKQGFIPFYVCATLGTTACCSFDNIEKIGPIARRYGLWLHLDGAYGANSFICPEFRCHMQGIELADSLNFNPNKWLLTNFDASVLWVADKNVLTRSMVVNPVYLQHKYSSKAIDFRHWGIPLSRRFRALKLWFVIRKYGAKGLRAYIRNHVRLAKLFASLVETDSRFEIIGKVELGLVCFRIKGSNTLTQCLIRTINESRELHMVPAMVNDLYIIRFAVCREAASDADIQHAWKIIISFAEQIIAAEASLRQWREHTRENSIRKKRRARAAASALQLGENGPETSKEEEDSIESSKLDNVPEDDEVEIETEEDDNCSTDSSDLGDLETYEMADSDIISLATERLMDLKELGAKEAYHVLAQQLKNLGVNDVKTYEECDLSGTAETVLLCENPAETIEDLKEDTTTEPAESAEVLEEHEELAARHHRVGRFKSFSVALALKGADRFLHDNRRISHQGTTTEKPPVSDTPKSRTSLMTTPESSFLNGSPDSNIGRKLGEDAVSSTPFAQGEMESPRQSIGNRRFSLAANSSLGSSNGTPVVARLVSMVMNASGNGPMNQSHSRQHRPSLKPNMLGDIKEVSNSVSRLEQSASMDVSTINRTGSRKFLNSAHSNVWRVGMNQEEDVDDVFVSDSDLCVGSFSKESTLTRLRRQTLLKMISDPLSYKNNRRNFRSLRDQRRMTTLVQDYEPRERPKSEYMRRPTVQVCENIHRTLENGSDAETAFDEDLVRDMKRRNKSMFETSSGGSLLYESDTNPSGRIVRQLATLQNETLNIKSPKKSLQDSEIIAEESDDYQERSSK